MAVRNSGMFWEPGAFGGYLIVALLFIAVENGKFQIGNYLKEVFWIILGIFSTMSTTSFVALAVIINIYIIQNHGIINLVIMPIIILIVYVAYVKLDFMQKKINDQFLQSREMGKSDISNTRFGALAMDLQYIQSQPLVGNGLDVKTRFRFHPWVKEDIGHGNGMSNFLAYWGIPFFLFWLYRVYRFSKNLSQSSAVAWSMLIIIILILQGEQYLNYPIFLLFFVYPYNIQRNAVTNKPSL